MLSTHSRVNLSHYNGQKERERENWIECVCVMRSHGLDKKKVMRILSTSVGFRVARLCPEGPRNATGHIICHAVSWI